MIITLYIRHALKSIQYALHFTKIHLYRENHRYNCLINVIISKSDATRLKILFINNIYEN